MELDWEQSWSNIPDHVLLQIYGYLKVEEILTAGAVCSGWFRVSRDELLWKSLVKRDWNVDPKIGLAPGKLSWQLEYRRLWLHTPLLETEILKGHTHQVLHVSFSHNGKYFATCSKDGYILLWDAGYPARIKHYYDMKTYSWKNTQYSQFNESDTLLLVSGVHFGTHSNTGEIAVFNIVDDFVIQCRVTNKPYDFFGTWYNDSYLLSGDLRWLAHLVSTSIVWLNRASQEADSELTAVMNRMFKFYNRSASSIRSITVANCLIPPSPASPAPSSSEDKSTESPDKDIQARGNPISHRELSAALEGRHQSRTESMPHGSVWPLESEFQYWRRNSEVSDDASPQKDVSAEEADEDEISDMDDNGESESNASGSLAASSLLSPTDGAESRSNRAGSADSDESEDVLDAREKFLIFTMGSTTYTPHQIGLKRIAPFTFCRRIEIGPESLAERVERRRRDLEARQSALNNPEAEPVWHDYDSVASLFDPIDHVIDLNGHIIGMCLSPDHRYLYVNVRPWPPGCVISNPLHPPPIAQEIDIHVIDLVTLKQVGTLLRAHRAYTPNDECFFIFLDVSHDYVASGAEDKNGYLWDRHYGVCLAKFPHLDVVNSVAFNPRDPEMLITASDDFTLKIWRSRVRAKRLGLEVNTLPRGIEYRRRGSRFT